MVQTKNGNRERKKSTEKGKIILKAAMQEFLANGYAATSMDRIATRAAVSKATVYNHFQDKQELFTAIVKQLAEGRIRKIFNLEDPQGMDGEPRIVLRRLGTKVLKEASNSPDIIDFMRLIIGESGRFPELGQAYINNLAKPVIGTLTKYFASCRELKIADPEATARVFMGTIVYYIVLQEALKAKEVMPMESDRLIDTLVDAIVIKRNRK